MFLDTIMPSINAARRMDIKVNARLYIYSPGHQFLKLFENNARRNEFVKTVVDAVEQLQLEGLYFFWEWPACSPVNLELCFLFL
jgi:hypothetical protein